MAKRDPAWEFYLQIEKEEKGIKKIYNKCKSCVDKLYNSTTSLTKLKEHLTDHHQEEYQKKLFDLKPKQQSINQFFNANQPNEQNQANTIERKSSESIDLRVLRTVIFNNFALNTLKSSSFKEMIYELNPTYKMSSQNTFKYELLPKLFNGLTQYIKKEVKAISKFSLTIDYWSNKVSDSYLGVTIHFINATYQYQSYILAHRIVLEQKTGAVTQQIIEQILKEYDLKKENLLQITADAGRNILSSIKLLGVQYFSCFGHFLNNLVEVGLKQINVQIISCTSLVHAFKYQLNNKNILIKVLEQLDMDTLKLIKNVPTRWNSTFNMIQRIITNKNAFIHLKNNNKKYQLDDSVINLIPDEEDWKILQEISIILEKFNDSTEFFCGDEYLTLSSILPVKQDLQQHLNDTQTKSTIVQQFIVSLKQDFEDRWNKYYQQQENMLLITTFLDLRFKCDIDYQQYDLDHIIQQQLNAFQINEADIIQNSIINKNNPTSERKIKIFKNRKQKIQESHTLSKEIKKYQLYDVLNIDEDPLLFWKTKENEFPILQKLALILFSFQSTSVPCERLFSKSGMIFSNYRLNLKHSTAEQLIMLYQNNRLICDQINIK
ncbi:hypothetical protein ABPG72_019942 [Tetrahymena utriculariae]